MTDDSEDSLFFYQQRTPARRFKRVRKEPEELPQALRYFKYANLNPRIAAFLGKQDPKNTVKRAKGAGGGHDEKDPANGDAKPVVAEATANDSLGLFGGFGDGLSQEARSLLPEIGQGGMALVKMGMLDDSIGVSRMSFNETDDPQRYQFEETTFAAPNILRELSDTLLRFDKAFTEYVKRSKTQQDESDDATRKQPADVLPGPLKTMLCQEWPELIAEAVFTPRVWQSQAYKSGYKYASTLASAGRQMTGTTALEKDSAAKGDLKGMVDLLDVKPTKLVGIDDPVMQGTNKKRNKDFEKEASKSRMKTEERITRPGGVPTLSFNLSSKRAIEEGWVVHAPPDPDLEQTNLLEWATGRLQTLIKQKEEEEEYAKKKGCDKPPVTRFYGDSRRDTLMKLYRKSNETDVSQTRKPNSMPKIPQLSKIDNTQRERFMVQLPDGTTSIYYPGGNVAVMASAVPNKPGELYVNCYDNDADRTCLAAFTPYGKSCCYHKNGVPALVLSEAGGVLKSEDGSVSKKWIWPKYGKMKESILFHLNKEMYVRVTSRDNVTLHFSCSRESHKINVGTFPGAHSPSSLGPDQMGTLQAGLRYTSRSAMDYGAPLRQKEDKLKMNRMRRNMFGPRKQQNKKSAEVDELKKSLDCPDRFEFESQADRELQRLQHKSRLLIDDWMEHYRLAVGICSPALKKMLDKSVVKSSKRNVRSATERRTVSSSEDSSLESTRYQSFRSPSAPPKHMAHSTRSVLSDSESKSTEGTKRPTGQETAHVRIDETATELKTPSTGKRIVTRHYKSASTMESRSRTGRSMGTKTVRSSILANMSTPQPTMTMQDGRPPHEKVWAPATEACPVTTRLRLLHPDSSKVFACKCSKHRVPDINDVEFDTFVREVVPQTQLVVICVTNSFHEDSNPYSEMLEHTYISKNRNRTKPCLQCRHDQYRILSYDLAKAHSGTDRSKPLLLERHCVVPGMTLMYCGGKLLFADHIFNGYGNARKDFRKQIFKSRQEFHVGHYLPDDFRFSPSRGKSGPRAAWGGEIGGTGVRGKGKPGLLSLRHTVPAATVVSTPDSANERFANSASLSSSSQSDRSTMLSHLKYSRKSKFDSAREFVQFSLSAKVYIQPTGQNSPHRRPVARSKNVSTPGEESAVSPIKNFLMMQAVK